MIGIDGYGWIGTDKFGREIDMTETELREEREQNSADARRPPKLYISEEYKLFFLTAQQTLGSPRGAYISVRAFHMLEPETVQKLKAEAEPWDKTKLRESMVDITPDFDKRCLVFDDGMRQTSSTFVFSDLDADVKAALEVTASNAGGWGKYFGPQHAFAAAAAKPVAPMKPISFQAKAFRR